MFEFKSHTAYIILDDGFRLKIYDSQSHSKNPELVFETSQAITDIHIPVHSHVQYLINWPHLSINRILTLHLDAPGSHGEILGMFYTNAQHIISLKSTIAHHAPHTTGNCLIKGIITDSAQASLSGMIQIDHPASNSLDQLTERLLILSPDAIGELHPELEILTNEVKASHATTISRPDPEQLFFLQSRGVQPIDAIDLLISGFLAEVQSKFPLLPDHQPLTNQLSPIV